MNIDKFQGMADEYAKYRPSYPECLYQFLCKSLNFSHNKIIADIGAGTGKFSKPLVKEGFNIYCIEPNEDMKDKVEKD
jgi:16S rRNA A1518/A1519 N6-dimethyltransferase RsmA/KsgA/DIM1 with predicted DNA glycosylase/AP lyase activity